MITVGWPGRIPLPLSLDPSGLSFSLALFLVKLPFGFSQTAILDLGSP